MDWTLFVLFPSLISRITPSKRFPRAIAASMIETIVGVSMRPAILIIESLRCTQEVPTPGRLLPLSTPHVTAIEDDDIGRQARPLWWVFNEGAEELVQGALLASRSRIALFPGT